MNATHQLARQRGTQEKVLAQNKPAAAGAALHGQHHPRCSQPRPLRLPWTPPPARRRRVLASTILIRVSRHRLRHPSIPMGTRTFNEVHRASKNGRHAERHACALVPATLLLVSEAPLAPTAALRRCVSAGGGGMLDACAALADASVCLAISSASAMFGMGAREGGGGKAVGVRDPPPSGALSAPRSTPPRCAVADGCSALITTFGIGDLAES